MEKILRFTQKYLIPKKLYAWGQPIYHYGLAFFGAIIYNFPSKKIKVVAVTGTKGKTSVVEILVVILDEAGFKTALSSTLRFKIGSDSKRNMYKMTIPGRFFLQKFLSEAVLAGCDYAIVEMTSEGAKQFRHKFINLDALIFTNLAPEHIESHGSYEKYVQAKLSIAESLEQSPRKDKVLVVNKDDNEAGRFLEFNVSKKITYSITDAEPFTLKDQGIDMTMDGKKIISHLTGRFNIYNILAGASYAKSQGIKIETIKIAIEKFKMIRGRVERLEAGQDFDVIVDYAHTPDSLEKLYEAFPNKRKICVLGNTGGGRDKWKRKEMAKIADEYCWNVILTNEDPYDEDPLEIVKNMENEIKKAPCRIVLDRREAMHEAFKVAQKDDAVLITGKGTDPYIMGPNGSKTPWDDADVAREEIKKLNNGQS